jgi:polysaccharide deacetylase 2 family uncharacterized protein YibQ
MSFHRVLLLAFFLQALPAAAAGAESPRLAVIIDDLGYALVAGERAINLPGPVAYAILPGTPRAAYLAEMAHKNGKEVLLHLPLQAENDTEPAEPGSLSLDMSQAQFARTFIQDIESVPHAIGVSNHRGSLLTRHPGHMSWLMEEIRDQGNLFFVDSYTTAASIALKLARETGVPSARRDVFLDPDQAPDTIAREFTRLKKLAQENGFAIGIGHPYPATLSFLEKELPKLGAEGFQLIRISELVALRYENYGNEKLNDNAGRAVAAQAGQ